MRNLSKNFTLEELLESPTARRKGYTEQFEPSEEVIQNLTDLCINILQPLRDKLGQISVTSGYRCERTNKAVGGKPTSQHQNGMAVDIQYNKGNAKLYKEIKSLGLPYDQLIAEGLSVDSDYIPWIHVSYNPNDKNRKQELIMANGKYYNYDNKKGLDLRTYL